MSNFTCLSHWTYKKTKSFILNYPCGLVGTEFTSLHSKASNHRNIASFYEHWLGLFLKDIDITRNSTIKSVLSLFLNYLYFAGMAKFIPHLDYIMKISSVQSFSRVRLFATPWKAAHQASLEFTQTHVHWVGDAIQPSHPRSSTSPPPLNPSQHQGLFQWVNSLHDVAKVLEFQLQSHQRTPRADLL